MKPELRKSEPNPLTDADLDRALSSNSDSILPSSGFTAGVMAAVREETAAPAPIPFPWKRALPGFLAALVALGLLIAAIPAVLKSSLTSSPHAPISILHAPITVSFLTQHGNEGMWLAVTLLICLGCLLFCRLLIVSR